MCAVAAPGIAQQRELGSAGTARRLAALTTFYCQTVVFNWSNMRRRYERGFRPRITYKQTGQAKKSVSGAAYATYRRPASAAAAADSVPYFPTVSSYRTTTPAYTARSNNLYLYS
ncbi:unnamed protein product [Trichogramma brassicae]|uniref:Uncharacterized protein n=1 Tax=Trichogramma brassicae TaxID=86971 RepID=A0A6H5IPU5_9HYME|nr:unnamed protein product [Trichogramma brassicae]